MASFRHDLGDKRVVAGRASIVVVGTVLRQTGAIPRQLGTAGLVFHPQTQFDFQILAALKADVSGVIRVNQMAGYNPTGQLNISGYSELLEVGTTYILAARYSRQFGWYSVLRGAGVLRLPAATDPSAAESVERLVEEWREAVAKA